MAEITPCIYCQDRDGSKDSRSSNETSPGSLVGSFCLPLGVLGNSPMNQSPLDQSQKKAEYQDHLWLGDLEPALFPKSSRQLGPGLVFLTEQAGTLMKSMSSWKNVLGELEYSRLCVGWE